jgi:hypothetical protein
VTALNFDFTGQSGAHRLRARRAVADGGHPRRPRRVPRARPGDRGAEGQRGRLRLQPRQGLPRCLCGRRDAHAGRGDGGRAGDRPRAAVDCVIAFGGGSTIGLAKAIAWRTDLPQIAVPTTYAGSEVTNILGQTENGVKTTLKSPGDPRGCRLRRRTDPHAARRHERHQRHQRDGPRGRGALCPRPQPDLRHDRGRGASARWPRPCRASSRRPTIPTRANVPSAGRGCAGRCWGRWAWRCITSFATPWAVSSICRMPRRTP